MKKVILNIVITLVSIAIVIGATYAAVFFYYNAKYPADIVLEGAICDISMLDLEFSNRDLNKAIAKEDCKEVPAIKDNMVNIDAEGKYRLTGEYIDCIIIINVPDDEKVQLLLDNVNIKNQNGPAIYVKEADKVFVTTNENSVNTIEDGAAYEYIDGDTNVDSAIFSKVDITFNGTGKLVVKGNCKHGIVSKDDLNIANGQFEISSKKVGINGKDCVKINDGDIVINAGTDGIRSDNAEESHRGFVYVNEGNIDITCGNDGIQAENAIICKNPNLSVVSGGGSVNAPEKESSKGGKGKGKRGKDDDKEEEVEENKESVKGIKSVKDIIILGGTYVFDCVDDAIHADNSIKIEEGNIDIKTGDDAVHAENTLYITGGDIYTDKCFEGLEGEQVLVEGGNIYVIASDDGINASSEIDEKNASFKEKIKLHFVKGIGGKLEIAGGNIYINSKGDGLDSNGIMSVSGGVTIVAGESDKGNCLIDCDGSRVVVGGTVLCIGKIDEETGFSNVKNQKCVTKSLDSYEAGNTIVITNSDGEFILEFESTVDFDSIMITSPLIKNNDVNIEVK